MGKESPVPPLRMPSCTTSRHCGGGTSSDGLPSSRASGKRCTACEQRIVLRSCFTDDSVFYVQYTVGMGL